MPKNIFTITPLLEKDIQQAAQIHRTTIKSPGSAIGDPYLQNIYQWVIRNPTLGFGMAAKKRDTGDLVGSILVTFDREKFGNVFVDPRVFLGLIFSIVSGRVSIHDFLQHRTFQQAVGHVYQKPYVSIQALSVAPSMQRMGIGRALVESVCKQAKRKNISHVYVDTLIVNKGAQKFYRSMGFNEIKRAEDSILYRLEV